MENKNVKVGCIGLGPRGRWLFECLLMSKGVTARAICDISKEKTEDCKNWLCDKKGYSESDILTFTDYHEMLQSDVEAIIVATDVFTHTDIACDCVSAGKHVLCEIPNMATVEEAKKLLKTCRANPNVKFMVAENCCYWSFINTWKKMYEDGLFGEVTMAEGDYIHKGGYVDNPNYKTTWRSHLTTLSYLTHELGPLLHIMGDTCTEVSGFFPDNNPYKKLKPAPADGVAIIKTKKGCLIKISAIHTAYYQECAHNYVLYGTNGTIQNERHGKYDKRGSYADLRSVPNNHEEIYLPINTGYPNVEGFGHGGADTKMMADFVDCIVNDKKPSLDVEFGVQISLPGVLARESGEQGGIPLKMPTIEELLED